MLAPGVDEDWPWQSLGGRSAPCSHEAGGKQFGYEDKHVCMELRANPHCFALVRFRARCRRMHLQPEASVYWPICSEICINNCINQALLRRVHLQRARNHWLTAVRTVSSVAHHNSPNLNTIYIWTLTTPSAFLWPCGSPESTSSNKAGNRRGCVDVAPIGGKQLQKHLVPVA